MLNDSREGILASLYIIVNTRDTFKEVSLAISVLGFKFTQCIYQLFADIFERNLSFLIAQLPIVI